MLPLLPHQEQAVQFLIEHNGRGLLYMDAGTGKTFSALAYTAMSPLPDGKSDTLIICPASVKDQWFKEAKRFFETDTTFKEFPADPGPFIRFETKLGRYVITNYETCISKKYYHALSVIHWDTIILDECHYINNPTAKRTKAIKKIVSANRIALSGTPMPNALHEIWSVADWLHPGIMGKSFYWFKQNCCYLNPMFHGIEGYREGVEEKMHKAIATFTYRVHKEEALPSLPAKKEHIIWVDLDQDHRRLYDELKSSLQIEIQGLEKITVTNVVSLITRLRQLTDWPPIFTPNNGFGAKYNYMYEHLMDKTKTIIFTEFAHVATAMNAADPLGTLITGKQTLNQRTAAIQRFTSSSDCVRLYGTAAMAHGLNLQVATRIVHFGLPWNGARLDQRTARAWRYGQTQEVDEIYILARDTIDEKMYKLIQKKRSLEQRFTKAELLSLLS